MPRSAIAVSRGNPVFNFFEKPAQCFPWQQHPLTVLSAVHRFPNFSPHPRQRVLLSLLFFFFIVATLIRVKWHFIVVLITSQVFVDAVKFVSNVLSLISENIHYTSLLLLSLLGLTKYQVHRRKGCVFCKCCTSAL